MKNHAKKPLSRPGLTLLGFAFIFTCIAGATFTLNSPALTPHQALELIMGFALVLFMVCMGLLLRYNQNRTVTLHALQSIQINHMQLLQAKTRNRNVDVNHPVYTATLERLQHHYQHYPFLKHLTQDPKAHKEQMKKDLETLYQASRHTHRP